MNSPPPSQVSKEMDWGIRPSSGKWDDAGVGRNKYYSFPGRFFFFWQSVKSVQMVDDTNHHDGGCGVDISVILRVSYLLGDGRRGKERKAATRRLGTDDCEKGTKVYWIGLFEQALQRPGSDPIEFHRLVLREEGIS